MSSLSLVCGYGSTSDDSDSELGNSRPKKLKLQLPDLSTIPIVSSKPHLDNPSLHEGRIRSFQHVRGNWASFVYVRYSKEEYLYNLRDKILSVLETQSDLCHICDDFHISLSKTLVLQYHLITSFTKSLQEAVNNIECFELDFASVNIYCNEDNTRTFISLEVDYLTKKKLVELTQQVDSVLEEFKLPVFYEDPSFHMSIFWLNGNQKEKLKQHLNELNSILKEEIGNNINPILVSRLNCKIGNKFFQFSLK